MISMLHTWENAGFSQTTLDTSLTLFHIVQVWSRPLELYVTPRTTALAVIIMETPGPMVTDNG